MKTVPAALVPAEVVKARPAMVGGDDALEGLSVVALSRPDDVASDWRTLERYAKLPFSDYAWANGWYEAHRDNPNVSPVIVIGRAANEDPLFLLPLSRERRGPFTVLLWPGGTHSAYQCGLFSPACRELVTPENAKAFWARIFAALPRADALAGYGLPVFEIERHNPLSHLPLFMCGCASRRMALSGDWDALYRSKTSSKARGDDRRCERRIAAHGGLQFRVAATREDRQRLLEVLIAQKSARFEKLGVPNFLDQPGIPEFYGRLIDTREWQSDRSVFMSALELDGETVAVNLGITQGTAFFGMILSMATGEIERFGPGRMLLRRSMEHLCRNGFTEFDFGVGEDPFKDHWSDEIVERRDVLVWLNVRGWAFVSALRLFLKAKAAIKHSPLLWRLFSHCRRSLGC